MEYEGLTKYAEELNMSKTKISFFSSTPKGGDVVWMRHALVRFFHAVALQASWNDC